MGSGTSARSGAHLVLDTLEREGVNVVFGYPGGAIMPLYDALYDHGVRHVLTRHEAAAVFAAGGYARSSGKVGVCLATSGPGATNLVTGILDAMMDSVPLVAITGQVKSALLGTDAFQEADVVGVTQGITKRNFLVRDVAHVVPTLRAAFRIARGPRPGPVLVDIPSDVLKAFAEPSSDASTPSAARRAPVADAAAIERAAAMIASALHPVIIGGGGVRNADAVDDYREFCALTGAPHAATLHGLGCAHPDDPNFLGMAGMHGWKRANVAIDEADVLVALGMRFDDRITGDPKRFAPNARIVHADIDASELNKVVAADVALHGDVKDTLRALNVALRAQGAPFSQHAAWATTARAFGEAPARDASCGGALSATDVLDAFFATIEPGTIVATDVGQHQMWAAQRARAHSPRDFLSSGGLGAMGFGFPAAIGAQFAHPHRTVVAIVGDGGFQMALPELATLGRYGVPVKVLLLDNRNLGMVRQWQQIFFNERYSATSLHDNPDFCAIARAYGVHAQTVSEGENLDTALRQWLNADGPALLHCACFPMENVWPMIPSGTAVSECMDAVPA